MRVTTNGLIAFLLSIMVSLVVRADQMDNTVKMLINQMKQDPVGPKMFACLEVSESKFYTAFEKTLRYCFKKHANDDSSDDKMDTCFESQTAQNLKINPSKITECENKFLEDGTHSGEIKNDGSDNMSPEEIQQAGLDRLKKTMTMLKTMSQGTEDQITLPIYAPSEIVSHFTKETSQAGTAPVAMFQSSDSVAKIIAFYDAKLSHFDKKLFDSGMAVYMENMPEGFDLLNSMDFYQKTPHVTVYSINDPSGSKTMIEIAYPR